MACFELSLFRLNKDNILGYKKRNQLNDPFRFLYNFIYFILFFKLGFHNPQYK